MVNTPYSKGDYRGIVRGSYQAATKGYIYVHMILSISITIIVIIIIIYYYYCYSYHVYAYISIYVYIYRERERVLTMAQLFVCPPCPGAEREGTWRSQLRPGRVRQGVQHHGQTCKQQNPVKRYGL